MLASFDPIRDGVLFDVETDFGFGRFGRAGRRIEDSHDALQNILVCASPNQSRDASTRRLFAVDFPAVANRQQIDLSPV